MHLPVGRRMSAFCPVEIRARQGMLSGRKQQSFRGAAGLRSENMKLRKAGHVVHQLKEVAHLVVNAQDIKKYITNIKQKPDAKPGLADRDPESTGRTTVKS